LLSNFQVLKKAFLVFLIFFYSVTNAFAQHSKADSLRGLLAHAQQDTNKVNTLLTLASEVESTNLDTAMLLSKQALVLSRAISWKAGEISSMNSVAIYYDMKGNINNALACEDSALGLSNKYHITRSLGSIYNILGNITSDENKYPVGLDYYFKALAIDSLISKSAVAQVCNNVGIDYQEMGNYVKAEEYYLKTLKIYEESNNKEGIATIYCNLGNLYNLQNDYQKGLRNLIKAEQIDSSINNQTNLIVDFANIGEGYLSLKNYEKSLEYSFKAILLGKKLGALNNLHTSFSNVGQALIDAYEADTIEPLGVTYVRGDEKVYVTHSALLDTALVYEQNSILRANIVHNELSLTHAYRGIGQIFALKKENDKSISYYQRAYDLSDSLGVLGEEMDNAQSLGHAFVRAGNYQMAAKYLDITNVLKDSIFSKEKNKQITELEAKYQNEKKEKEIEALAQKNEIQTLQIRQSRGFIFGLVSLVLLIAAIAFLLIRQGRINTLNTKIELEQKLLRSQMNPHFIFNAMTSIQNYIYKEEPQEAANYLSSVFKLMRSILESSKEEYILLEKEVITLKHYLVLQQLCFQNKFDYKIDVDQELDIGNITIPPMMAQPIIENAIEHGIVNKVGEKGMIIIRFVKHNDMFSLEVEDNGVGRDKAREIGKEHKSKHLSVATNITQERITLLNRNGKKKITMQIIDLKNEKNEGTGTKVVFSFPLNMLV
jgi:tetratricopeptide (TPR) repeat protein